MGVQNHNQTMSGVVVANLGRLPMLVLLLLFATSSNWGLARADIAQRTNPSPIEDYPSIETHDSGPEALEIIKARGFIGELYNIPTGNGAVLAIYHIINPLADPRTLNKYPVLEHHGVIGDAAQMMGHSESSRPRRPIIGQITVDPTDTCLAFFLANNNFDVWMLDARGTNVNSRKAKYDYVPTEGLKYWNFTLDDEIQQDLPRAIEFVLEMTHEQKLHYIGFSQSTLMMFSLLSWRPHYADRLVSFVAMAPVAYVADIQGATLVLFSLTAALPDNINANFLPQPVTDTMAATLRMMCMNELMATTLCSSLLSGIGGVGPTELSKGLFATTYKATSIKKVKHLYQLYLQKRLGMYDHGLQGNMAAYGQPEPPAYDLRRVRFPYIILFRGDRDLLSDPADQQRLLLELGVKPYIDFHFSNYQHLDFLMSKTIVRDINLPAGQLMLHLLRLHAAQLNGGIILRDPRTVYLPRPFRPLLVSVPDGNRRLEIRNDMVHNMINGIVETIEDETRPRADGSGGLPLVSPGLLETPLNVLRSVGNRMDTLNSQMSRVTDLLSMGSVPESRKFG